MGQLTFRLTVLFSCNETERTDNMNNNDFIQELKTKREEYGISQSRLAVAEDNAPQPKTYVLHTACREEHEPEEFTVYHGTRKHNDNAGFIRPCVRGRSKQRNAKSDSMIYNDLYNVLRRKYAELGSVAR